MFEHNSDAFARLPQAQALDASRCTGYLDGVIETVVLWHETEGESTKLVNYCFPKDGIPVNQTWAIVKKWLDDHPEKLHWTGPKIVWAAFIEAFPCK
jgi:hypothetical protein